MSEVRTRIAVLGPRGTYSEMVARKHYEDAEIVFKEGNTPEEAIHNVFDSVVSGEVDYGIVPREDSVEGAVSGNFDLFRTHDVYVTKDLRLDVVHSLVGTGGEEELTTIVSHPQALKHCRRYLSKNFPDLRRLSVGSTADAARMASEDTNYGAIANEENTRIYPALKVMRDNVHDYRRNETGFDHIGPRLEIPDGLAKTSAIMYPALDYPGLLLEVLEKIKDRNINLSKIVSYPSKGDLGDYIFEMVFDCGITQDLKLILEEIKDIEGMDYIRILGTYDLHDYTEPTEPPLKLPVDTIEIDDNVMKIDASVLDIGIDYTVKYLDGNIIIRRQRGGVLQIFEEVS